MKIKLETRQIGTRYPSGGPAEYMFAQIENETFGQWELENLKIEGRGNGMEDANFCIEFRECTFDGFPTHGFKFCKFVDCQFNSPFTCSLENCHFENCEYATFERAQITSAAFTDTEAVATLCDFRNEPKLRGESSLYMKACLVEDKAINGNY